MADVAFEKKEDASYQPAAELKNIVICLMSIDKRDINRTAREFAAFASEIDPNMQLPLILPTEEACFTTRKSPCGNGTATFSRVKLRVYKREFRIAANHADISRLVEFLKNSSVDADFRMNA